MQVDHNDPDTRLRLHLALHVRQALAAWPVWLDCRSAGGVLALRSYTLAAWTASAMRPRAFSRFSSELA